MATEEPVRSRAVTTAPLVGAAGRERHGWRRTILTAGLAVGLAGAALTATGLYAVAVGSGVPPGLAWLYVAATDGLALVAYGATSVLVRGRGYAWLVVLAAAGLSGLAQAAHLAQGGGTATAVQWTWLRFGVGYWPAVSVTVCAHLLWLVADRPVRVPAATVVAGHGPVTIPDDARNEPAGRTYEEPESAPITAVRTPAWHASAAGRTLLPMASRTHVPDAPDAPPEPPPAPRPPAASRTRPRRRPTDELARRRTRQPTAKEREIMDAQGVSRTRASEILAEQRRAEGGA